VSVRGTSKQLRDADDAARQAIDDKVPNVVTIPTVAAAVNSERPGLPQGHGTFADVADPQAHLVTPVVADTRNQVHWTVLDAP
jgi:hypothetical protein